MSTDLFGSRTSVDEQKRVSDTQQKHGSGTAVSLLRCCECVTRRGKRFGTSTKFPECKEGSFCKRGEDLTPSANMDVLTQLQALEDASLEFLKKKDAKMQDLLAKRRNDEEAEQVAEEAARVRVMLKVVGPLDVDRPENSSRKEDDWPMFSLTMRAHADVLVPRFYEQLQLAEELPSHSSPSTPKKKTSVDRVHLEVGDDELDSQWYFVLTMMLKEASFDKIELLC